MYFEFLREVLNFNLERNLEPGAYPEIFQGGVENFLYGRENLGGFGNFFLKRVLERSMFSLGFLSN